MSDLSKTPISFNRLELGKLLESYTQISNEAIAFGKKAKKAVAN